ncbi:MAG TPA: serine hydrolase domain-containing protein [Herpetosiphonaceae bacterium]
MTFSNSSSTQGPELHEQLAQAVSQVLATSATPGAAVALVLDGRPVFASSVGFRDHEQTTALDTDAQFYIYSVTKTLLATVILQLVEQEQIALDTPIQTYLPQAPLETPVTIRQILNHTGGLPDYGGLPIYFEALRADPMHAWTSAEFLAHTLARGWAFPPEQGWAYSNIGYLLLGQVIEAVRQMPLHSVLHERLFAPLELRHTFMAQSLADAQSLTPGYSSFFTSDDTLQDIRALYDPGWVSHRVVVSTASELARLIDAIFSGELLRSQSRAAMLTPVLVPHTHPLFRQPAYGLGLMIDPQSSYGVMAGHGGGGPGYSAGVLHVSDAHGHTITSVALANRDQPDLGLRIAFTLIERLAETLSR